MTLNGNTYTTKEKNMADEKKTMTIEEFDSMSPEEQDRVIRDLQQELGGHAIPMNMYVPENIKQWWDHKVANDKAGSTSIELLMSKFFMAMIRCTMVETERGFMQRIYIALALLIGQVSISQESMSALTGQQMCDCEEDGTCECPFDDMDELPRGSHDPKKTIH